MRNVGGIAQTEAQKSSDLFMKCRYLDEITGGKGIVFATGTPIIKFYGGIIYYAKIFTI